jgi:hypothetical protein
MHVRSGEVLRFSNVRPGLRFGILRGLNRESFSLDEDRLRRASARRETRGRYILHPGDLQILLQLRPCRRGLLPLHEEIADKRCNSASK